VLVVEDDLVSYQALARWLSEAGYFPIRARKGEEALEMARTLRPTAITLDLSLPGLSGWDVLRALKEDERTRHLPVVVISMMDNRELGLSLGVDDYFLKPVDRERLLARIRELAPPQGVARLTRLLVIDDDPLVHSLLGDGLPAFGLEVRHAHTGREGLEAAMQGPPDAIVLDLLMPEMSGFEVAAALQARPETEHVPVIVLTAHDLKPDERARLSGKIDGLVRKGPRTPARLAAAIRELESRRTREVARAG
jgi:CheY-like chemotaxis protein